VHRIGRTGRAGANGEAISLLDAEEFPLVKGIEKLLEHRLNIEVIKGFEPTGDLSAASKPKSTQTTQPRKKSGQPKSNKPKSNSTSEKPYRSKRFNSKRRRRG